MTGSDPMADPTIAAARELFEEAVAEMRDAVDGLPPEALAWRPPAEDSNTLTILATHAMHSSRWWLTIARGAPLPDRDRPSEFVAESGSVEEILTFMEAMAEDCRARLDPGEAFDAGAERTVPDDEPVSAAWALFHALEHLREHVAQAQLTRQLWLASRS
ncbi:MAG TPA: DinB family protein [Actinomycetota bacterium]|nr:DinB family protein [Actinomycetota bacterium]